MRDGIFALCLLATGAYGKSADIASGGEIVADSGFRAQSNGFRFENWGGEDYPEGRLDIEDVRYLFGDRVCESLEDDECAPTPAAQLWIEQMNQLMEGGHCEGMAALSAAFFTGHEDIGEYGASTAYALPPEADLLRVISAYFTTQMLEPVASETQDSQAWPLEDIVEMLKQSLDSGRDDYYTLGIYGADGGHAVTPYALEDMGNGEYRIHVYDNNYPGADKYVEVDTANDHWVYALAALNPSEDSQPWEGGSGSMDLTSVTVRLGELECPFCGDDEMEYEDDEETSEEEEESEEEPQAAEETSEISLKLPRLPWGRKGQTDAPQKAGIRGGIRGQQPPAAQPPHPRGPASLFAFVDGQCERVQVQAGKHRLKLENGKLISQIAGGHMRRLRGSRGCLVRLPADGDYQFSLRGAAQRLTSGLTFVAPGRVFKVSDLSQSPDQVDKFRVAASALSYLAGTGKAPKFTLATDNPGGEDALYTISDAVAEVGKSLSFRLDRKTSRLSFAAEGGATQSLNIRAVVSSLKGRREFSFDQVKPETKGWGTLNFDREGGLKLNLEKDGKHPFTRFWDNKE